MIGTGYVGLVTGTCFANLGNEVICLDIDEDKIHKLNQSIIPIYEPGLKDLVELNVKQNRLVFTTDKKAAIQKSDILFIAVGTPESENGEANLDYVKAVAKDIAQNMQSYKIIVNKSTVPVGTADMVREIISKETDQEFDVVSNPEFLKEGAAISDFLTPDRVVLGVDSDKAVAIMKKLYSPFERANKPIVVTDVKSAEMIKYASNAMLATRISFMNEIARICEKVGADVKSVSRGMGLDSRIGPRFLQAGVGYGGSCFPKDSRALINTAKNNELDFKILKAVDDVNEEQKQTLLPKIKKLVGDLNGKNIAIWGLSFKPKTDDIREAPALVVVQQLLDEGANINAFDPVAKDNFSKLFEQVTYLNNSYDVLQDVDCLVILTEWDSFRELDKSKMKELMKSPNIVDGRNIYDPKEMRNIGFNYIGVGR